MALGNYTAFYVAEPFSESSLGAHATKDFCYYNLLKSWKAKDSSFPFTNSHDSTYNVRDNSNWETTLKPRLRERLRKSKNIVFFLSSSTLNSRALREELDYGINELGLPVIVIYPDYDKDSDLHINLNAKQTIKNLWGKLPVFRDSMHKVPTLHVPMKKETITLALENKDFISGAKTKPNTYFYTC